MPRTASRMPSGQSPARFPSVIGPSMMAWMTSGNARLQTVAIPAVMADAMRNGIAGLAYG